MDVPSKAAGVRSRLKSQAVLRIVARFYAYGVLVRILIMGPLIGFASTVRTF